MPNRLASSTSPYLLQHAGNPVAWQPWDEQSLAQARREGKPIFLSIGYSACHWCHVMEHESFEHEGIAALLNEHFVPIKVDREERPDLDEIYMEAVQALTGRGGWPMSVWLTPDLKPFYGGTYFPRESRRGMTGFGALLERIAELWRERRGDVEQDAEKLTEALVRRASASRGGAVGPEILEAALRQLRADFDPCWGGFGSAPKFPAHFAVELLLRNGGEADRAMARRTLDAMWEGGMYDHLGGGFARYSVDERWLVPHFEKMLYDNAQLACCYLEAFRVTGEARYGEVARETLDYLLRDLRDPEGGFHSSEDADSEGEEGRFYVFTPDELHAELGPEDGDFACRIFGVSGEGNFEHGTSVLHRFSHPLPTDPAEEARIRALALRLRTARDRRVRPGKDDKVLAAWNGLALSALARGYQLLGDPRYLDAASACAAFLHRTHWQDETLLRVSRKGPAQVPGFLEDYAALAEGLVDLFEAGFDAAWLRWAEQLADQMCKRFEDDREGGFFFAEANQPDLLLRPKGGWDGALPAASTLACRALLRLARQLGREDFRASVERALVQCGGAMSRSPRAFLALIGVVDDLISEGTEIVVAGDPAHPATRALLQAAWKARRPGAVLSLVAADPELPLHQGRDSSPAIPEAHVCHGSTCRAPIRDPEALAAELTS